MTRRTVLLVDDDQRFRATLGERLQLRGFDVVHAGGGEEALKAVRSVKVDAAVVDLQMPGMDGLATIEGIKEYSPGVRTILLTGHGGEKVRQATQALESDYFDKADMSGFWSYLSKIKGDQGVIMLTPPSSDDQAEGHPERQEERLIALTRVMQDLKEDVERVAALDCTVLIMGETGTGKELVARTIHNLSQRADRRFLAVNCGSFSHDLLSKELFGQEPEAREGEQLGAKGVFEAADGGTILLDEVGDTPLPMQSQLLRILQDKKVLRLGGTREIPLDVRIMATTNQDLASKMRTGGFREDFYYRLNVFTLHMPPLRERLDDIPPLCSYFLLKYNRAFGKEVERLDREVMDLFMEYPFPGNVRELENIVERAVIICPDKVVARAHLPRRFQVMDKPRPELPGEKLVSLAELEEAYILKVLEHVNGNRNEAARVLGISRAGLWRKLKKIHGE